MFIILCPHCRQRVPFMHEFVLEFNKYACEPTGDGEIEMWFKETLSMDTKDTACPLCKWIFTEWTTKDFLVKLNDDGTLEPIGEYWLQHREELPEKI